MKLKLIIFDYDGLLVESEKLAFLAEQKIIAKYSETLTRKLFDTYIGYSVNDTLKGYMDYFRLPISVKELYNQREDIIAHLLKTKLQLMPGALPILKYFDNKGINMVIASSGELSYIELGLKKLSISHFFKNITSVNEVKKGKPSPDLFLEALRKNSTKAEEAVVLEDAISGIKAAKAASIFCIAIPPLNVNLQDYRIANFVVDSLENVQDIFEKFRIL